MKICTSCRASFDAPTFHCPQCGHQQVAEDGFPCFAPALAHANDGFDPEFFRRLRDASEVHFLLRYRNRLIISAIRRFFPEFQRFLEIGCGTGAVLKSIAATFPERDIRGSELFLSGLAETRAFVDRPVTLYQMDAMDMPFVEEFDLIGLFDVLEHIDDDVGVLKSIRKVLKPGAGLIVTVPQHPFLWSKMDEIVCHKRRYRVGELRAKVEAAGYVVEKITSYNTLVLPALMITRLLSRREPNASREWDLNPVLNGLLHAVSLLEGAVNARLSLPIGGSAIIIARKPA